jgi:exodeoxyribonuclease VII large subunit
VKQPVTNLREYSVSELSFDLKRTVEDAYGFVRVRGEVSGYRGPHASGHCYFKLKDEKAVLESVVWRGVFQKLKFKPEEGLEVIVTGKLTTYPGSSRYQIVIEALEPAGEGALMALLEERKRKLATEGLFDPQLKKDLPYLPRVIGVVTSPTGAVIRDILHRLADRFPVQVIVWPVRVQGEASAAQVTRAIEGFNRAGPAGPVARPDLIIVARGGGSLEDLWSFNEEIVVRAAAASAIPIISAVGHETDWTLLDLVADLRAPTPTGAAELAVPVRSELLDGVDRLSRRHRAATFRHLETLRTRLSALARLLPRPAELLNLARQRRDDAADRLSQRMKHVLVTRRAAFDRQAIVLTSRNLRGITEIPRRRLTDIARSLRVSARTMVQYAGQRRTSLAARVSPLLLARPVHLARERLAAVSDRGHRAVPAQVLQRRRHLDALAKLMVSYSYQGVLKRGFAVIRDDRGRPIRTAAKATPGRAISIEFTDGRVGARVTDDGPPSPKQGKAARPVKSKGDQGSLF